MIQQKKPATLKMLWELLVFVAVIRVVQRRWLMRRQRAQAKQLKTNMTSWPILGHMYKFARTGEDGIGALHRILAKDVLESGGLSQLMYFDQLIICVADPTLIQILMTECLEKHDFMKVFELMVGNSSFLAPVPIWRRRRKMMLPSFTSKVVAQYFEVFSKQSTVMADLLEKEVNKEAFSCWNYILTCSFNSVCETTMGVKKNAEKKFLIALEELWNTGCYALIRPWLKYNFISRLTPQSKPYFEHRTTIWGSIRNQMKAKNPGKTSLNVKASSLKLVLADLSYKSVSLGDGHHIFVIIKEKQKLVEMESNDIHAEANDMPSYLGYQLKTPEHQRLTQEELFEECLTILVAGFDTTARASSFTILNLSRHPEVQEKVYKELEEVLGESDRPVCQEDLHRLKYMEAVIKETLRLYPPVPNIARNLEKDIKLESGLTLVKGCGVMISIWATHRNPTYWGPDTEQFRPERFLDTTLKHPAAFIPFGYGPRSCVGNRFAMSSMKTTLSTLLRRYRVLPPPGVQRGEPLHTTFNMLLKHTDNYQIRLQRRH